MPTAPITTRAVLYGPEVALYLTVVHDINPDTALFIITEMATGLRWGETAGLHVTHLDPAGRQLHIVQTYAYLLDETTGRRRWQIKPYPKGKKQRIVPISPDLAALLTRHVEGCHADQLLFRSRTGTYIDYNNQRNRTLQPALTLARERGLGKHITPHALRHTMITMLRDGGVAPGIMQLIAGHATYQTTATYADQHTPAQRTLILNAVQPVITGASALFDSKA